MSFWNHYYCEDCDISWSDVWDCQCDDKCPQCNKAYCPETSEEIQGKYSSKIDPVIESQPKNEKEYLEFTD